MKDRELAAYGGLLPKSKGRKDAQNAENTPRGSLNADASQTGK